MDRKRIVIRRVEAEIWEDYKPDRNSPVCVHYLPEGCSIKGARMTGVMSSDYLLAEQVVMEVEEKLQRQSMRILGHPLKIKSNMIGFDSLETGSLSIFEFGSTNNFFVDYSSDGCSTGGGVALIGKIDITIHPEEKTVKVENLYCEHGYEELEKSMMEQVQYFAIFYDYVIRKKGI